MAGMLLDDEFRALIALVEADTAELNGDIARGRDCLTIITQRTYEALQAELVARGILPRLPHEPELKQHVA